MILYLLGILTLPIIVLCWYIGQATVELWNTVARYGAEDERILTWGGKKVQRLFQFVQRKPYNKRPNYPSSSSTTSFLLKLDRK